MHILIYLLNYYHSDEGYPLFKHLFYLLFSSTPCENSDVSWLQKVLQRCNKTTEFDNMQRR